jgi:NAD(P)-dependent dehydrogenase (short-subunit alcohol dehydrogenase family)
MKGKVVVITGGNGQCGQAAARRFAELGATIFLIVRKDLEIAENTVASLANDHLQHKAILASTIDTSSLKSAVEIINKSAGKCDLLINAAGITKGGINNKDIDRYSDDIIDEILINNVRGTFAVIREFTPLLKNSNDSLVINITSAAGIRASPSNIIYGASKVALELITKTLSRTLAPTVRVVAICPGILENSTSGAHKPPGTNERMAQEIPLKRVGTADDVVATIESLFLSMKYVTGSSILLDGGRLS